MVVSGPFPHISIYLPSYCNHMFAQRLEYGASVLWIEVSLTQVSSMFRQSLPSFKPFSDPTLEFQSSLPPYFLLPPTGRFLKSWCRPAKYPLQSSAIDKVIQCKSYLFSALYGPLCLVLSNKYFQEAVDADKLIQGYHKTCKLIVN